MGFKFFGFLFSFFVFAFVFLAACTQRAGREQAVEDGPPQIIDAHIHLPESLTVTETEAAEFTASRVVGAVAHAPRKHPVPESHPRGNPFKVAYCAAISETVPFADIERALQDGSCQCLKVYLGYVKRYASDALYSPFYQLAEKYQVPVVFHTGDTYDTAGEIKYSHPITIDEVAVAHPNVNFLIAHMGNPWIETAAELAYKNDNVYVDSSALLIGDLSKKSAGTLDDLLVKPIHFLFTYVENPKKVLFGTDWPLTSVGPYLAAVKRAIPREHWNDVFYENAARLFKL
jgi:hypothetical protein